MEGLSALVDLKLNENSPTSEPDVDPDNPLTGEVETWLNVVSPAALLEGEEDLVDGVLVRGLYGLNRLIRALRLVQPGYPMTTVSIQQLDAVCFVRLVEPDGATSGLSWHLLLPDLSTSASMLSDGEEETLDQVVNMQEQGHPFFTYREWFDRALHAHDMVGDNAGAVLALQTAVESLLLNVLRMTRVDQGDTSDELLPLYDDPPPFKTLLTTRLHPVLRGAWTISGGPVGDYWTHLYEMRNRVIHTGYVPTEQEVSLAFEAYEGLMDHVANRLRHKCNQFPRTFFTLVGVDGAERRGWMTRALRAKAAELRDEGPSMWLPVDLRLATS